MTGLKENRLKNARSPYLRSAAHQPVEWREWGEEAFATARAHGKPVLLDIGAVWCHWCHVIDRESYDNPEIAALINRDFVPVKVDRDERPDIDARYQAAIGALTGQGGWPLTAFLTPDGRPFFGGTYFPPDDAMGRPGFKRLLAAVAEAWQARRGEVESTAGALAEAVAKAEAGGDARGPVDPALVDAIVGQSIQLFDPVHGGFGQAPKFPHPAVLDLLLERHQSSGRKELVEIAETTLEKMARGGVADQLAGGFHRYSVDERWRVPHFEKMIYDNAQLLANYVHAFQITRQPLFRQTAEGILGWTGSVLADPERGGFFASQDADSSLEDDGDYFTWTPAEIRAALPPDEASLIELYYGVSEAGDMHHNPAKNVLHLALDPAQAAPRLGLAPADFPARLERARAHLLAARLARPAPKIDPTIYVGWNAMMVSAWLEAAAALGRPDCAEFALRTLDRLLAEGWNDSAGFAHLVGGAEPGRSYLETSRGLPSGAEAPEVGRLYGTAEAVPYKEPGIATASTGLLDDHVFAALALLDGFEHTLQPRYFHAALRAAARLLDHFYDRDTGGLFDRPDDAPPLGAFDIRRKPFQDSPTPGANSLAAVLFDRLFDYTGERRFLDAAERTLEAFGGAIGNYGMFAASYGLALLVHLRRPIAVVVTGRDADLAAYELERAAHGVYRYAKAVLRVTPETLASPRFEGSGSGSLPPSLAQTLGNLRAETPEAYVCVRNVCYPPVSRPEDLAALLLRLGEDGPRSTPRHPS